VRKDPARARRADIPLLLGDPGKLRRATGWRPRYAIEQTLADLLEYWRAGVRAFPPDSP
jgi:GDP-4-dehydro-6-deoxy-D-mannose reductase